MATRRLGHADEGVRQHPTVLGGAFDLDQLADGVGGVVQDLVDDAGEILVVASRRAEQQPERGPVVGDEPEVGAETHLDALAAGVRPARRLGQLVQELAADVGEQLDEQRPFRREMLVQDGLRDAGGGGDVVHGRRGEAAGREHVARDVEELSTALLGRESHRHRRHGTRR